MVWVFFFFEKATGTRKCAYHCIIWGIKTCVYLHLNVCLTPAVKLNHLQYNTLSSFRLFVDLNIDAPSSLSIQSLSSTSVKTVSLWKALASTEQVSADRLCPLRSRLDPWAPPPGAGPPRSPEAPHRSPYTDEGMSAWNPPLCITTRSFSAELSNDLLTSSFFPLEKKRVN